MAEGGWSAGKIILVVVLVVLALGALCCGGMYLISRPYIAVGKAFVQFQTQLQKEYGKGAMFTMIPDDDGQMTFVIGVKEDLTPERVVEIQDKAWNLYADAFSEGAFPVQKFAIGRATAPGAPITQWADNAISIDELAERTGVSAPPVNDALDWTQYNEMEIETEPATEEGTEDGG